ncbi:hypothetical protein [Streptoalloteichus hindustanus]|nr:hypothetical protein [Streptoalloteichus hindustanus]
MVLMLANREVPNTELANQHKIKLSPDGRDRLNRDGLLRTRTETRPYVHQITEEGISWCVQDLVEGEPPSRSGPLARAYAELLRRIVRYHQQRGTLVEAIRSGDLESLIRAVYLDLSVKPQDWVRLAKLRPRLNGADKDEVDKVLLGMIKTGKVHLAPDSNRKVLTDADHAAAIRIGSEDKHLLAIEES